MVTPPATGLSLGDALRQATAAHCAGDLAKAADLYRAVLATLPDQFDALHLLGVLEAQQGRVDLALALLARAVALPSATTEAWSNFGIVQNGAQRYHDALAAHDRALALRPGNPKALNNRGVALQGLARHDEALASFDRALAADGRLVAAWCNRGRALQSLGRFEEALASQLRALAIEPDCVDALHCRANALCELGRVDEGLADWARVLVLRPDFAEALNNRGAVLRRTRRHEEALRSLDQAVAVKPDFAEAWHNRAGALRDLGRREDALASYTRALALAPGHSGALEMRGYLLHVLGRNEEASRDFADALRLAPESGFAQGLLLQSRMYNCDWHGYDEARQRLVDLVRAGKPGPEPFVFAVHSDDARDQLRCARTAVKARVPPSPVPVWQGERHAHERIRVAYLSADFHDHATAYLIAELFERHDRSRFEVTGMSWGPPRTSAIGARIRAACERFDDVSSQSDREVAQLLREREIDIAIDLKGFTNDARPGIFAQRGAPLQVNYLGYPATMGAPYIDYLIADEVVVPPEQRDCYAEQVVYMPDSFQVNDRQRRIAEATPTRAEAGLPDRGFVFCSFNNHYKFTPDVFSVWMRVLQKVEGSVLWLLAGNDAAVAHLKREAAARGVAPERLVFAPRCPLDEHLARHRLADLFLDTLPCNAHTTASDALWTGLPVLTCLGTTFAGRVAASLLRAVGLPELITPTLADYEALALRLAVDPDALARIRRSLAGSRDSSPLFDTARFTRHLEAAYCRMWQRFERGEAPAGFAVAPIAR
ncbi:MAG: tetratricopeptide repeat protein [Betaproteobacteria bacterium]